MEALKEAAAELCALIGHSFGPCAQETLLLAPPNAPVITSDGHAVLMAWRNVRRGAVRDQDAMAAFLLDAAHGVHTQLGDGTSTFLLMVHAALKTCSGRDNGTLSQQQQLSSAFGQLKVRWRSPEDGFAVQNNAMRIRARIEIDPATSLPTKEFHATIANVLQTALRGMVHDRIAALLVEIVVEWVFAASPATIHSEEPALNACQLWQHVQFVLKHAPDRILFALSTSIDDSHVLPADDFIVERSLMLSQPPELLLDSDAAAVRFVCFTCPLSMSPDGANPVTISRPETMDSQVRGLCATTECLRMLREQLDVRLLICSGTVEESVASICTQLKIACVQLAEDQDIDQLCIITGITPLASIFDQVSDSQHVGVASGGVARVRMSQTAYLHFHALQSRPSSLTQRQRVVPQMILKAPTKGVYKQLYAAVYKALRVLASWWEPAEASELKQDLQNEVYCCRGAGVGEEAAVRWLQDESLWRATLDPGATFVRRVMANALIDVIVLLRSNLSSNSASSNNSLRTRRRELLDRLTRSNDSQKAAAKQHAKALVLDPQHVIPTLAGLIRVPMLEEADPLQYGVVHPWNRLNALVLLVLETLERAFRINRIVRVKRLPKTQDDEDTGNQCLDS